MYNKENVNYDTEQLFKDANMQQINYCHWKSNEHIVAGIQGRTDLDILVSETDYDKFTECLCKNGFIKVSSMKWQKYPHVEDWIGMSEATGVQVHIHMHRKLITGKAFVKEQYLPYDDLILENKKMHDSGIYVVDPNIEIIILVLRTLIKRPDYLIIPEREELYKLSKGVKKEWDYLIERIEENHVKIYLNRMFSDDIQELFLSVIFEGCTCKKMKKLKKLLKKALLSSRRMNGIIATWLNLYRYLSVKVSHKIRCPINTKKTIIGKGISITFIGVDGSGKSTISKNIKDWLSWKLDCRCMYLGSGDGNRNILNRILRLYSQCKKKSQNSVGINESEGRKSAQNNTSPKGIKLFILNINSCLNARRKYKLCKKMFALKQKGIITISDRFPQLEYVGINDGLQILETGKGILKGANIYLKNKEKKYFEKACSYSPDIVIKLIIPYEVSRARKSDSPQEAIMRKIQIVDALTFKEAEQHSIENTGDINDTLLKVKKIIWTKLYTLQEEIYD